MLKIDKLRKIHKYQKGSSVQGNTGTNNTIGSNGSNTWSNIGKSADLLRGIAFGEQKTNDSNITQGIDQVYNNISDSIMMFSPIGTIIGGAMKVGAFVGDGLQAIGGGTDQMTVKDQILDSPLFSWNIGAINGFGGEKTQEINLDDETISQIGSSYGGTVNQLNSAKQLSGKKYGLFSERNRKKADNQIAQAKYMQNVMTDIADEQQDRLAIKDSMTQLEGMRYGFNLNGGINQRYLRAAKSGMKIQDKIDLIKSRKDLYKQFIDTKQKEVHTSVKKYIPDEDSKLFKEGGILGDPEYIFDDYPLAYKSFITDVRKHAPNLGILNPEGYNMLRYWELNGKPLTWNSAQLRKEPMFVYQDDGQYHANSIAWNENGEGEWMKSPDHSTYWKEEAYYDGYKVDKNGNKIPLEGKEKEEWENFRNKYYLEVRGNQTKYKPKKEDGGKLEEKSKETNSDFEQKNVIPEGALHKNKHHMEDCKGLTKKGIPVINNEGEQQAEIEKEEIIFTLEVTNKLEEAHSKYKEGSQKEKDQLAIEIGKLLVEQILYNTEDRTGLIDKIQENETA